MLLLLFPLCYRIGKRDLWDPDEGRNSQVVQEIHATGRWVIPYFNGRPRLEKPPLFYWTTALITHAFGLREATLRSVSFSSSMLILFITFLLTSEMWGYTAALYSSLILATSILFLIYSRIVIFDMFLTLFTTIPFYAYWRFKEEGKEIWLALVYFSLAGAILTKGPIGLFPLPVIFLFHIVRREETKLLGSLKWGIPLLLILVLPWFIYVGLKVPKGLESFILKENIGRLVHGVGHKEPFYFYLFLLMPGTFPWWASFPRLFFLKFDKRGGVTLALFWFFSVFIFFSFSSSKAPQYILPALPPFSLLAGKIWEEQGPREAPLLAGWTFLCLPFLFLIFPMLPLPLPRLFLLIIFGVGTLLVLTWNLISKQLLFLILVLSLLSFWSMGNLWIEKLNPLHSGRELVQVSHELHYHWGKPTFYKSLMPSILFYLDKEGQKVKKGPLVIEALKEQKSVVSPLKRFWEEKELWNPQKYVIFGKSVLLEGRSGDKLGNTCIQRGGEFIAPLPED